MKILIIYLLLLIPTNLVFAQTVNQAQLLQARIDADNAIVAQDQADIASDTDTYNRVIKVKQDEINTLTAEIQGAKQFLDMINNPTPAPVGVNWSDTNAIQG